MRNVAVAVQKGCIKHVVLRVLVILAALGLSALASASAFAHDTVYYYLSDALHSEVVVTDQNRNVVETTYYAPYGQVLSRNLRDGPGYAGAAEDPGTGLDYMQQRYYDPQTGRFISTDPVSVSPTGGNFNRYAYANDNPYRYTDPDGRASIITYNADGSISIQIPVNFTGPAATAANIAIVEAEVSSRWNGTYTTNGAATKVSVAMTAVTSSTPKRAINNITLVNGSTPNKATAGASYVNPDKKSGVWSMSKNHGSIGYGGAAHEAGHLMGINKKTGDQYTQSIENGVRTTEPKPGYAHDLMDQASAPWDPAHPTNSDMRNILHSPVTIVCKSQQCQ